MWLWMVMPCVVVLLSTLRCHANAATLWLRSSCSIALPSFLDYPPSSCWMEPMPGARSRHSHPVHRLLGPRVAEGRLMVGPVDAMTWLCAMRQLG